MVPKRKPLSDDAEWMEEMFARAKRGDKAGPPGLVAALRQARRTRSRERGPQKAPTKQLVSLRLSRAMLEVYRSTGPGWQARIDADLQRSARRIRRDRKTA